LDSKEHIVNAILRSWTCLEGGFPGSPPPKRIRSCYKSIKMCPESIENPKSLPHENFVWLRSLLRTKVYRGMMYDMMQEFITSDEVS